MIRVSVPFSTKARGGLAKDSKAFAPSGEEPILRRGFLPPLSGRVSGAPPAAQHLQQAAGEHGISVLLAFALPDPDQHALGIDIAHVQGHHLGDAQAGAVGGHQRGAIANGRDMLEELGYFDLAEDYRQFVWHAGARQHIFRPGRFQSHVVEKFRRRYELVDGLGRQAALVGQVQLIFPDLFQAEMFRAGLVESGQTGNVMHVVSLRLRAEVAQLHVFEHAAP